MNFSNNFLIKFSWWSVRKTAYITFSLLFSIVIIAFIVLFLYMKSLPPLYIWHNTELKNEFTINSKIDNFTEYISLEKKLFQELEDKIYKKVPENEKSIINRYTNNSLSDPKQWDKAWNKSFELPNKNAKMGALLLHGMSDSPYTLHTQAEYLQKKGVWVLALRLPGHGTIPSGLTTMKWQDMAKVVEIAMKKLKEKLGDKPIHIMGYSTGAALALNYTFNAIKNDNLTIPSSLIFYSPAIGVSKFAPLAVWQNRLAYLFSMKKLKWNSIEPEYDPFKYNSFAVNAGDQIYRLCNKIQTQFDEYSKKSFPPILTFQSIVDNTVSVPDVVNNLYKRLPKGDHSLVMFDINHNFSNNLLIKENINNKLIKLRQDIQNPNYTFDLISNKNSKDGQLELIRDGKVIKELSYYWPRSIFSLSHLAMPISMHDKLYGESNSSQKKSIIKLGQMAMYGETDILQISPSSSLRQRWNPFHKYIKYRVEKFLGL